jgi:4'-phosphopantetheinyl transferase
MSTLGDALQPGDVHLWLVDCAAIHDPALLARYRDLLSEEEYARQQRYRFQRDRHRDLVARALVRTSLSRYAGVDPANWRFEQGEHGKPRLVAAPEPLNFNLSHSHERVVCAIARNPVGVDIEYCGRANDVLAIAERYFSASESRDLFALAQDEQRERFFDYWTLKEAYMKARGEGIALGLGNFSFSFAASEAIAVGFDACLQDDPCEWQFRLMCPQPDYRMAVALRERHAPLSVQVFNVVPPGHC